MQVDAYTIWDSEQNILFLLGILRMLWIRNILGRLLFFKEQFHFFVVSAYIM